MRPAAILNFEAEREAGMIPEGPLFRLEVSAHDLVSLRFCLTTTCRQLIPMVNAERDPLVKAMLLDGFKRLLGLGRLLSP